VYAEMEWWTKIRQQVKVEGVSKRQVLRETGIHWTTLEKILTHSNPPGYQLSEPRPEPKIGPFKERIAEILKQDQAVPRKQRHSAKRIFERIGEEGYCGGYTQVKEAVREIKQTRRGRCLCRWCTVPGRRRWTSAMPWRKSAASSRRSSFS